jgi:hypothetical protein
MMNVLAGARTLVQWGRALRGKTRSAAPVDAQAARRDLAGVRPDLDALLATVRRDGVAVVPGYWSAERAAEGRREMDRLLRDHPDAVQTYSKGADKRMYGVEQASAALMGFHDDAFLRRFGELTGGRELYNFATLGARIKATPGNSGSGNGWHRDAHGFQFKAIVYLSDARMENGPFEYLIGSHTIWRAAADSMRAGLTDPQQTRFTDAEVEKLRRGGIAPRAFPGRAGTLLLVNTAGIHRGMPLFSGERYALTNYYYNRSEVDEGRIAQFSPLVPGTADRIRRDLS